jgi:uncharacterized protein (TIGR03435 family)
MRPALLLIVAASCWGQAGPRFEIADVHASVPNSSTLFRTPQVRGGRFELKGNTMVDLIRNAYDFTADKILGGPSWLEMDRFEVIAKLPAGATPESERLMLQGLLAERFKLALHKDTRPFPVYALTVGKKPLMKEADGAGESGCTRQPAAAQYDCRNMTMAAFAESLRRMPGMALDSRQVVDQTGLDGKWNFGLTLGGQTTVAATVEQQLGLKLEEKQVPMPVIVVDSVEEKPSANPPDLAERLGAGAIPTKFAVASVKPMDPAATRGASQTEPGGRVTIQGQSLRVLIGRAFETGSRIVAPAWANSARFDIYAEADMPPDTILDADGLRPMMLALLVDRFKMTYHTEEQPVTVYALLPAKPKMKRADPASRTWCNSVSAPAGSPPAAIAETCQNFTMARFAERLQSISGGSLDQPVVDATGLEGGWDFNLVFVRSTALFGARAAAAQTGDAPAAADPSMGYTIFEALEKELGLKVELQKRTLPVTVIDHLEEKPTAN